jgi:hypothetical protein
VDQLLLDVEDVRMHEAAEIPLPFHDAVMVDVVCGLRLPHIGRLRLNFDRSYFPTVMRLNY